MPRIETLNDTTLNGITSDLIAVVNDRDCTIAVIGLIQVRKTTGRDADLSCGNGFVCAGLHPFDYGHVMALELGGSNSPFNIVPQFKHWQETGAWRIMENKLKAHNGLIMKVEVRHDRTGAEKSRDELLGDWINSQLMSWLDPRIPNFFDVKVYNASFSPTQEIKTYDQYINALTNLNSVTDVFHADFDLGDQLPDEDHEHVLNSIAVDIFDQLWEDAVTESGLMTPMRFMAQPTTADLVRKKLLEIENVTAPEATGFQMGRVCRTYYDIPMRRMKKMWEERGGKGW